MENNTQSIPEVTPEAPPIPPSEFKGSTLQLIGWRLLGLLLCAVTIGIATPWAQCMIYRWETKHTYVNGKQLHFDGKGHQLLGKYLLWGLLTIITFGIYGLFIPVQMHKWRAGHTRFAIPDDEIADTPSGAMIFGFVMTGVAAVLLIALVVTLLAPKLTQSSGKANPSISKFFEDLFEEDEEEDPFTDFEGGFVFGPSGSSYIIDNGDGTFTIIYGNPTNATEATQSQADPTSVPGTTPQNEYRFTDDQRIVGSWLMRAVLMIDGNPTELEAAELNLKSDGTFSYFKDIFSGSSQGWHPDGLADSYYNGTYSFQGDTLTLHYTSYFSQPYSSDPGNWVSIDKTISQTITFADNDQAIYFSDFSAVMNHNGYFEPIYYCPRITNSIGETLGTIYPNGLN